MSLDLAVGVIAVAVPVVTALGWLFKIDGRVTTHEEWRKQHIDEHKEFRDEYRQDSQYFREKLDEIADKVKS